MGYLGDSLLLFSPPLLRSLVELDVESVKKAFLHPGTTVSLLLFSLSLHSLHPRPLSWKDSQALGRKKGPCWLVGKSSLRDMTFLRLSREPLGVAAVNSLSSLALSRLLWRQKDRKEGQKDRKSPKGKELALEQPY